MMNARKSASKFNSVDPSDPIQYVPGGNLGALSQSIYNYTGQN